MDGHWPDMPAAGVAGGQTRTVAATIEAGVEADAAADMAAHRMMPADRPRRVVPPRGHPPATSTPPTGWFPGAHTSPVRAAAAADRRRRGRAAPPAPPRTAPHDLARAM